MNESVKLDLETYKNIIKMLRLGGEDRDLAIECIENMETSDTMMKLLYKPINTTARNLMMQNSYSKGHLGFSTVDVTLDQIEIYIWKSSVEAEKDIFNYLKQEYEK